MLAFTFPAYLGLPNLLAKEWPENKRWWTIVFVSGELCRSHYQAVTLLILT